MFLVSACILSSGSLYAQNSSSSPQSEVQNKSVTLRPVDTGRSVTFHIDSGSSYDRFAIKTDLLYGATLTPNLGFEVGLTPKTTLEVAFGYNGWGKSGANFEEKQWNHFLGKLEYRYWLSERFDRHFVGLCALYADYHVGRAGILPSLFFRKEYFYKGTAVGGGLSYGYRWQWNERWGMEFNVAVGMIYMEYDRTVCAECDEEPIRYEKYYFGPTVAGIKLFYMIM